MHLLQKLLMPDLIFDLFQLDSFHLYAKFFSQCSYKQKHYLMTQMLKD